MARRDHSGSPFGGQLRYWRNQRGISQLSLALDAGTTSRHVSFLETGRSRPSRAMVLRLSDALDISLRERNRLLESAGLPAAYRQHELGAPDLRPFQLAIERLMHAHEPYPALAVDGHWNVVAANGGAVALFGDELVGRNVIRRFYGDPAARDRIVNWPDVAWAAVSRLRDKVCQAPSDAELRELLALAEADIDTFPRSTEPSDDLVICPHFRVGDEIIRTISMLARFDTAVEVTLDELSIELTYPQDAVAERFFREQAVARSAA